MTDETTAASEARSAGAMLRAARERQGLHIAALAAAIKVPPAKLEALEAGRYEQLTDATFVRALAQSVCRVLKIDAKPVLDLLPGPRGGLLDRVDDSAKARFQEHARGHDLATARIWHQPVFWVVVLLLAAAAAFVLWPQRADLWPAGLSRLFGGAAPSAADGRAVAGAEPAPASAQGADVATLAPAATTGAPQASVPESPASAAVVTETVHAAPQAPAASAVPDTPSGLAVVRASEPSWIEAQDARGTVLLSRTLQPGESVGLDGTLPLKLVIGNAQATEVMLRGKRVTLGTPNRDNVVRLELR